MLRVLVERVLAPAWQRSAPLLEARRRWQRRVRVARLREPLAHLCAASGLLLLLLLGRGGLLVLDADGDGLRLVGGDALGELTQLQEVWVRDDGRRRRRLVLHDERQRLAVRGLVVQAPRTALEECVRLEQRDDRAIALEPRL